MNSKNDGYINLINARLSGCFKNGNGCIASTCRFWVKNYNIKNCVLRCSEPMTLDEIGKSFGVTRERIRQIEEETIKKLRRKINCMVNSSDIKGLIK